MRTKKKSVLGFISSNNQNLTFCNGEEDFVKNIVLLFSLRNTILVSIGFINTYVRA